MIIKSKTTIKRTIKSTKIYMETQCGKKTTDDDEHKQSTMRSSEYNATTITTSDSIKQQDYNLSYNLSHKSTIVETE